MYAAMTRVSAFFVARESRGFFQTSGSPNGPSTNRSRKSMTQMLWYHFGFGASGPGSLWFGMVSFYAGLDFFGKRCIFSSLVDGLLNFLYTRREVWGRCSYAQVVMANKGGL